MLWGDFNKDEKKMQTKKRDMHELEIVQAGGVKVLTDKYITAKGKEKERPWREKKVLSTLLSESYKRNDVVNKAERIKKCGEFLEFKVFTDGTKKLENANFCKCRLCPMCQWRRSRKVFRQTSRIMDYLEEQKQYQYIFLTTTFRNMSGADLPKAIDEFMEAFKRMTNSKAFKKLSKGFFRALEVRKKLNRDDFHPHMHVIIAVNKSYFDKGGTSGYLNHTQWMNLWRECAKLDYDPWVDIRKVKAGEGKTDEGEKSLGGAVAEISKYCTKSTDIILNPDEVGVFDVQVKDLRGNMDNPRIKKQVDYIDEFCREYTDEVVSIMDGALKGRRLISYGGIFREVHKLLNLDDPVDGDLINADNENEIREDLNYVLETYAWNQGYKNFVQFKQDYGQADEFQDFEND
jgi:plasmid rolling circle replication initiator protein Rep